MERMFGCWKKLSGSEKRRWKRMPARQKKRIFDRVISSGSYDFEAGTGYGNEDTGRADLKEYGQNIAVTNNYISDYSSAGKRYEEHADAYTDAYTEAYTEGCAGEFKAGVQRVETGTAANSKKTAINISFQGDYSQRIPVSGKETKKELKNSRTERKPIPTSSASAKSVVRSETASAASAAVPKFTVVRYAGRIAGKITRAIRESTRQTEQAVSGYSANADFRKPDTARQNIYNGIGKMFKAFAALLGMIFAVVLVPVLIVIVIIVIIVSIILALVFAVIDFFTSDAATHFTGNLTYVETAVDMANDPRYGYNTYYRTGEVRQNTSGERCQDYDNASFIACVLRGAEYEAAWFSERTADSALVELGFQELDYSDPEALLRGDIMMKTLTDPEGRDHKYYEIYAGDGKMVGAVSDENGGNGRHTGRNGNVVFAEPGDQNGNEIRIAAVSDDWEKVYRPPQAALDPAVFVNDAPEMFQYFYTRGYSVEQVCALLGNFMAESSCTFRNVSIGEMRLHGNEVLEYYGLLGLSTADAVTMFFNNANTGNMSRSQFVNPPHRFGVGFFMATTSGVKSVLWDKTIGEGINLDSGSGQLNAFMEIHARQMEELKSYTTLEDCTEYVLTCIEMAMPSIHDSWTPTRGMPSKEECMEERLRMANAFLDSFRNTSMAPNPNDEYTGTSSIPYIQLAIEIANHDIHQYGWGETGEHSADGDYGNFDCSHYVIYCLKHGGYPDVYYGSTSDNPDYYEPMRSLGWNEYDFGSVPLQEGDVLWKNGHIEFYVGSGMSIGAHQNYPEDPAKDISVVNCRTDYQKFYRDPAMDRS